MPQAIVRNLLGKSLHELRTLRPGAHQRHLASQHIKELRQLVQPKPAKKLSDAGSAWVVLGCPHRAGLRLGVGPHRTEFVHPEQNPVLAHTHLSVKDRPARGQLDHNGDQNHHRQSQDRGDDRDG